jgi:hypothetical protein
MTLARVVIDKLETGSWGKRGYGGNLFAPSHSVSEIKSLTSQAGHRRTGV